MIPLVALDWDQTLRRNIWPSHGEWMPGAVAAMKELRKYTQLTVFTMRVAHMEIDMVTPRPLHLVRKEHDTIRALLDAEGLRDVGIWMEPYKPPAVVFVDDRAMYFNGRSGAWRVITDKVKIKIGQAVDMYPEYSLAE